MTKTLRCNICNVCNNQQVVSNPGEFIGGKGRIFYADPSDKNSFICFRCKSAIDDVMYDYQIMDLLKEMEEDLEIDIEAQGDDLLSFDTDVPDTT